MAAETTPEKPLVELVIRVWVWNLVTAAILKATSMMQVVPVLKDRTTNVRYAPREGAQTA